MGRSVSVPTNAAEVVYFPTWDYREEDAEFDAHLAEWAFEDMMEELKSVLQSAEPSLYEADRWIGREDHVFLENNIVSVALSEYCGLCALSYVPKEEADPDAWWPIQEQWEEFASKWASDLSARVCEKMDGFDLLRKAGTFSNGEAVFQRVG